MNLVELDSIGNAIMYPLKNGTIYNGYYWKYGERT